MGNQQKSDDQFPNIEKAVAGDHTEIGEISGGAVAIGDSAQAITNLIERFEETNIAGSYVERQEITNTFIFVGSEGIDEFTEWLTEHEGVDTQVVYSHGVRPPSEQASRQIKEVLAAQRETAAQGVPTSPQASYRLGMLAAYRRDYDAAINYFQEAGNTDPDYSAAFEAIAWLQQSLAVELIDNRDFDGALDRLAKARSAAEHTDPLDANALALRGYIAKTLAQVAHARHDEAGSEKYYAEAARMFAHIVALNPNNPSAHNGLANVYYAAGDFDAAIASSKQAITLSPNYTSAHHDLALAYEAKWRAEPDQGMKWCKNAITAWRETYRLAPDDPAFSAEKILQIGQHIRDLEKRCG